MLVDLLDKEQVVLVDLLVELMVVVLVDFVLTGFEFSKTASFLSSLTSSLTALFFSLIRIFVFCFAIFKSLVKIFVFNLQFSYLTFFYLDTFGRLSSFIFKIFVFQF